MNMTVAARPVTDNRRRYDAPARRAQARETRARVLTAARNLFVERGFAVTVRQVAARAGVSPATVELLFRTKAALVGAVVDVALAGDDEPVPILDRDWVADLKGLGPAEFLAAAADAFAAGAARVAPVLRVVDEGAGRSPALAELAERLGRQRRVMAAFVVNEVVAREALAEDLTTPDATDTVLVLLDPALHRRLLVEQGWSADRFGQWLGRSFRRLLLDRSVSPRDG